MKGIEMQVPSCDFADCKNCINGSCKSYDNYRKCNYALNKSMLKAYQEECSIEAEQKRIIREINQLPEHTVTERNGFKKVFVEKGTVINIVENMPFL